MSNSKQESNKVASTFEAFSKYLFEKNKQALSEHLNEVLFYGKHITKIEINDKGIVSLTPISNEDFYKPFAICESKS